ncbi:hypothetical protein BX616_003061 [Lobosporangium transversale]|uniref:ADP-ribosylation/Crystallin J1 n=1 Tax=Lobosporangium transversale TaxID=64571 RepID=A0A1Y2GQD4_9FUNG|nr:ADP-ribosylation/Crystallin J1 [Lobosporangium transversale]KAF9916704.1 hypothetical protein BX616_003061 [Lobosporangium transversale]ORZ19108.1 ADP-ribosylation/Crystallin J1 [Lobosporangium transversale]|eukprot:XP_021882276.1 ADP-ribosylation/Crystallin J1 [Lobosporangium transversale]
MPALSTQTRSQLKDRIRGCLLGSAVGDAYGLATEFMTTDQAACVYGNGPIAFGREPGYPVWIDGHRSASDSNDFTDDTDQMLVILQSLEHTADGRLHPIHFSKALREWVEYGIPEIGTDPGRGLGYTVGQVLRHPTFTSNPHRAAYEVWDSAGRNLAPNGAVMRTAVLGIESFWDEPRVVENALAAAKVTHADPRSVLSALLSSVLISRLLRNSSNDSKHDKLTPWNPKLSDPTYRQGLLAYLQRGTDLGGSNSINPIYEDETAANQFQPKDYNALAQNRQRNVNERACATSRSQTNKDRPQVILRSDIGWSGIDHVGEDEAMGALARSVLRDYIFMIKETNVVPENDGENIQDVWAQELERHCFPRDMGQLNLGCSSAMGYALKCIGIAYYGATRSEDPSPRTKEYTGPSGLFRGIMEQVTLEAGDADTNGAVLGSLLGTRFGLEKGIPEGWWTELRHLNWLEETIDRYAERVLDSYERQ